MGDAASFGNSLIREGARIALGWKIRLCASNALPAKTSQGAEADAARVRALAAYKDFLTLWKDADPDIPYYKKAKSDNRPLRQATSMDSPVSQLPCSMCCGDS
jgi:hypothetical protein